MFSPIKENPGHFGLIELDPGSKDNPQALRSVDIDVSDWQKDFAILIGHDPSEANAKTFLDTAGIHGRNFIVINTINRNLKISRCPLIILPNTDGSFRIFASGSSDLQIAEERSSSF